MSVIVGVGKPCTVPRTAEPRCRRAVLEHRPLPEETGQTGPHPANQHGAEKRRSELVVQRETEPEGEGNIEAGHQQRAEHAGNQFSRRHAESRDQAATRKPVSPVSSTSDGSRRVCTPGY